MKSGDEKEAREDEQNIGSPQNDPAELGGFWDGVADSLDR